MTCLRVSVDICLLTYTQHISYRPTPLGAGRGRCSSTLPLSLNTSGTRTFRITSTSPELRQVSYILSDVGSQYAPRSNPSNPALFYSFPRGWRTIYADNRHIPCALNTPKMRFRWSAEPRPGNVSGGCKCRPISVKRNKKLNQKNFECTVCYRVVAY